MRSNDSGLLVPRAHARRRIDAQLGEFAGRQADRETRALFDRKREPGAGELLDLDRPTQPVGGKGLEPVRRARMGREEARIVAQRGRSCEQAVGEVRRAVSGQGEQRLGDRVGALRARCQGADIGRAVRAVFCAGRGECRHHAMGNQVQEPSERECARALIGNDGIGVVPRQDAGRTRSVR